MIDRSGLGSYFSHTAIVREKDPQAYAALSRERALDAMPFWQKLDPDERRAFQDFLERIPKTY